MANIIRESVRGIELVPIEDELLSRREIFLMKCVNSETMNALLKQLMYLEKKDSTQEITLYINSPGGNVMSGLAVYDYIRLMKSPLRTVCAGDASSMGAILFLAGDKREMLEHTRIMIHDPSYSHFDMSGRKPHEIQQEVDSLNECRETLAKIISEKTGKTLEEIYKLTVNDTFFNADEAVKFGLATGIYKGE